MKNLIAKLKCRKGQGAIEYTLITLAVVLILVAVLFVTGAANPLETAIKDTFTKISTAVTGAGGTTTP
ncbi:MAG: class III signal peptide-containing protein [Candidatus Omnitrophica bacterium]|nr:class III signal peptide-containing protein [Candidatus Omnitrophota bacterium]